MKRIIAGGTGFLGHYLVKQWLKAYHNVIVIGRDPQKIRSCYGNMVEAIDWKSLPCQDPTFFQDIELIVNLCGEGIANKRWSPRRKHTLIQSRVTPTKYLR